MRNAIALGLLLVFASCSATGDRAQSTHSQDEPEDKRRRPQQGPRRSPDDVSYMRKRGDEPGDGLIRKSLFSLIEPHWFEVKRKVRTSTGLDFGIAYTALFQQATDSVIGPDSAGGGDFDIFGEWRLVGNEPGNRGVLGFAVEDRHRYGAIAPADLGKAIGSLWPTTRAFGQHKFGLTQIYWDQHLADDTVEFRVGAYDHNTVYDTYTFRSETFYFQNYMFAGNVSFKPPGGGFGGAASWRPTDTTYLLAGIADANGKRVSPDLSSFFEEHEYFYVAEFGYSPRFAPYKVAYFHATFWHVDAREEAGTSVGSGVALTAQYSSEDFIPFLRYAYSDADTPTVFARQNVNAGFGIMRPFGRADDVFAFAVGAGQEVDGSRWQVATETFYRLQLTSYLQLTASVEGIFNPINNPDVEALAVFGLRLRFQL